jgi:quercetin dioxygenase-like cupin family protein
MNREDFTRSLTHENFNEALEKSLSSGVHNALHAHEFDVRALVTQGAISLTVNGVTTRYAEGDVFAMAAGCAHVEDVGAEGVTYLVGRRYAAPTGGA